MKKTILIGGGTGLVGKKIINLIDPEKYNIKILSRSKHIDHLYTYAQWDIQAMTIDDDAMDDVDYIINLSGAGIADKRWTPDRKKEIIDSRVNSSLLLKKAIERSGRNIEAIISASAIGYYGNRADEILTEDAKSGDDFLAETCIKWEEVVKNITPLASREIRIRIGIVLSMDGGALPQLLISKKFGFYNYMGDGGNYYSWIHIDDLARIFIAAVENKNMNGPYNAVSPIPITFKEFIQTVKNTINSRMLVFPIPSYVIRLLLGEMSSVVLNSTRVIPAKLIENNWEFSYPDLPQAINDLIRKEGNSLLS